jgi:hypothetical protein
MAAAAIAMVTQGTPSRSAMQLSRLGLLWWSAEEIMGGANWFRRLLGAAAGAYSVATLIRRRGSDVRASDFSFAVSERQRAVNVYTEAPPP